MAEQRLIDILPFEKLVEQRKDTYMHKDDVLAALSRYPTVDAVPVVRCKDCRWAEPYECTDGETRHYCMFCGNVFKYGTNWKRLFTPIRETEDYCSYGERRDDND